MVRFGFVGCVVSEQWFLTLSIALLLYMTHSVAQKDEDQRETEKNEDEAYGDCKYDAVGHLEEYECGHVVDGGSDSG